jgi:hypothetical protein
VVTNRKSAIGKVRGAAKEPGVGKGPARADSGVHPVLQGLGAIENRARLSLECWRYTQDPYWLACAFDDCQKGRLDWDSLCQRELGVALPPPEPLKEPSSERG